MASLFSMGTNSTHLENASVMLSMCLNFVLDDFNGPTRSKWILWFLAVGGFHGCSGALFLELSRFVC